MSLSAAPSSPLPRLSAIVITKNEARNLDACLASLAFCDEVVVVDSGSTDGTLDIARARGATVIERDWPGFGPQKEFARTQARGEWILSLDADERITPELRAEIERTVRSPQFDAYEMPRLSTFLGREMRYCWWPDHCLRLFRKEVGQFSPDPVHERVLVKTSVGRLHAHIEHHPIRTLEEALRKADSYSTLGAGMLADKGRHVSRSAPLLHGLAAFVKLYVLKRGMLDGPEGFLNACVQAQAAFWKYAKARVAQQERLKMKAGNGPRQVTAAGAEATDSSAP